MPGPRRQSRSIRAARQRRGDDNKRQRRPPVVVCAPAGREYILVTVWTESMHAPRIGQWDRHKLAQKLDTAGHTEKHR